MENNEPSSGINEQPSKGGENSEAPNAQAPPYSPNSEHTQNCGNQAVHRDIKDIGDRVKRAEGWMIGLTGAIAFFALCSVIVGWFQWNAINGQLDEMREEQRPWISVKITGPASALQIVGGELRLHVNYRLENVGKLPATRVFFYATIVPEIDAADFREALKDSCNHFIDMMNKSNTSAGVTLFPNQTTESGFGMDEVLAAKFTTSGTTAVSAFVPVCAVYRFKGDGGIFHYTPAAYILVTQTSTGILNVDVAHIPVGGIDVEIRPLAQGNLDPT